MKKIYVTLTVGFTLLATGCQSLSPQRIEESANQMRDRIAVQRQAQADQPVKPLFEAMPGSYIASHTIPLAYSASLPPIFRDKDVTLNFPARTNASGKVNLATIASRISDVTKLPVRIRPDVFIPTKDLVKQAKGEQSNAQPNGAPKPPGPTPMPLPMNMPGGISGNTAMANTVTADYDANLPMEYSGSLAGYLDFICARLGINWEYKDGGITMYRFVTKSMAVKVNPGDLKYLSSIAKGSNTAGAAKGESTGSGAFDASTSSSIEAVFSLWASMESAIEGMKSPMGSFTIDQAAGFVIITDTKDAVETVANYIEQVNSTLTRQIDLEVRMLTVSTTDTNQAGFDLNLLYTKMSAGLVDNVTSVIAPGSLTGANAGALGFGILKPTSRWNGSTVVVQALRELGTIIADTTKTATTTNRVPVPIANFTTEGYLASTTPAQGGISGGGGTPGLTPGQLTTGSFLNVLPTAFENGSVLLRLALDDTISRGFGVISSGSGASFQQIQTPTFTGSKSDHSVGLKDGESLVLMASTTDRTIGNNRTAFSGLSLTGTRVRDTQIIVVTPRVRAGI